MKKPVFTLTSHPWIRRSLPALVISSMLAAALPSAVMAEQADAAAANEAAVTEETPEVTEAPAETPAADAASSALSEVAPVNIRFAKNYQEVYNVLKKAPSNYYYVYDDLVEYETADFAYEAPAPGASAKTEAGASVSDSYVPATGSSGDSSDDYSRLNTREINVDEADLVRTDGKYIYTLGSSGNLYIAKASGKDSALVFDRQINPAMYSDSLPGFDPSYLSPQEMYVDNGRLIAVFSYTERYYYAYSSNGSYYEDAEEGTDAPGLSSLVSDRGSCILTFDISKPENPALSGAYWQNGAYTTSRKIGDIVYLYTEMVPEIGDSPEESVLVPCVNGETLPASDICIPNLPSAAEYLIVSSMNVTAPSQSIDSKVFLSGAEDFYVSESNLYVMNSSYSNESTKTEIARFGLDKGTITAGAASTVIGAVNDSFSIDEYNGYLRVLTTYTGSDLGQLGRLICYILGIDIDDPWTRHNSVYVLKTEDLSMVSRLPRLAEGEDIKSARFFGDIAYFVTFENTDPLFTADLSDPKSPKILGQLDVTGFSSYLHPYGDGLLLGMGYEADTNGRVTGLKLSMFDISDPSNVSEIDRVVISGVTYCEAMENYKTVLADANKNLIGFFCQDHYLVYSYKKGTGFQRDMIYDMFEDGLFQRSYQFTPRGLYSGSQLYVAGDDFLLSFDMKNGFKKDLMLDYKAAS